jgi:preprotein translocase subunit SecG
MLYGFLVSLFVFNCLLLILLILIQQGKGNMGLGNMGGGAQMLFGGSGGQDLFQKITWILGTIFMAGSLMLAIMKSHQPTMRYGNRMNMPASSAPAPELPSSTDY